MTDLLKTMRAAAVTGQPVEPDMLEAVKDLIRNGADTGYRRPGSILSSIDYAAAIGDPELIRMIVSRGADVEDGGSGSSSPLMIAVRQKNVRAVDVLLDMKADPDHPRYNPDTPLMEAVRNHDGAMVRHAGRSAGMLKILLDHGLDLHQKDGLGRYPITYAMGPDTLAAFESMLRAGAKPYLEDWEGQQPLYFGFLRLHQDSG